MRFETYRRLTFFLTGTARVRLFNRLPRSWQQAMFDDLEKRMRLARIAAIMSNGGERRR